MTMRWALISFGLLVAGCRERVHASASDEPAATSVAPAPGAHVPQPAWPRTHAAPLERHSDAYTQKLLRGFEDCGRARFTELGGHWVSLGRRGGDVWFCEGRILWTAEWGGTSELCITSFEAAQGDAEAVYHEDVHDPGDASGLYLELGYDGTQLIVAASDWETPAERWQFFVLERKPGVAVDADSPCPRVD